MKKIKSIDFGTGRIFRDYKAYPNYFTNKKLRRDNPNIRSIKNGQPTSFWSGKTFKDDTISKKTLDMIDKSAKNFAKGKVGAPIDIKKAMDSIGESTKPLKEPIDPIGDPADNTAFVDKIIEPVEKSEQTEGETE